MSEKENMAIETLWNPDEYMKFRGRVAGLEYALWEWSRGKPQARFIHPSLGNELSAFCLTRVLAAQDVSWALYYRSHAWLLALGVPLYIILTEIANNSTSPLHGRAGSMHLFLHPNIIDCNSIVGAQIPIAVGAAIANRVEGKLTVCVLGDGATNTGVFYESLNIASLYKAPVLFVIEDNGIAMDNVYERISSATIEAKFDLFSIPFYSTSTHEAEIVFQSAIKVSALVNLGPAAICVSSFRLGAHVLSSQYSWDSIAQAYSTSHEVKQAMDFSYQESREILQEFDSSFGRRKSQ